VRWVRSGSWPAIATTLTSGIDKYVSRCCLPICPTPITPTRIVLLGMPDLLRTGALGGTLITRDINNGLDFYRCTRPVASPEISLLTSSTDTRFISPGIECLRQPAATA